MYAQNAVVLALAGLAAAQTTTTPGPVPVPTGSSNGTITVTKVYDVYTTYCPGPTSFVFGGKDYVVTEPCTLTITDCPCTKPGKPVPGHPHAPGCEGDECEYPEKPGKPVTPEQPGKPVTPEQPGKPVTPEQPGKPVTPEQPGKPVVPEQPVKSEVPACEGDDCAPVIVNGAGAIQLSLGLAAVFGLLAL
ncbi:hypothetical protein MRS44_006576 [Fusarium solani]|uniref:uncharacterized protein n=1 Tax=Fusarium solani TaxID=169388 RepID=UPI0032C3EE49|nr:hypothetical protein MRS44_006576 [Fusarium solani]